MFPLINRKKTPEATEATEVLVSLMRASST